jgi:hypothetical protein
VGSVGDGSTKNVHEPVQLEGLASFSVFAGRYHTLSMEGFINDFRFDINSFVVNGEIWSWGANEYGQRGIGTFENHPTTPRRIDFFNQHQIVSLNSYSPFKWIEWSPKVHYMFPPHWKEKVLVLMMITLVNQNTGCRRHRSSTFSQVPKDILMIIFKLLAHQEFGIF